MDVGVLQSLFGNSVCSYSCSSFALGRCGSADWHLNMHFWQRCSAAPFDSGLV